MESKDCLYVMAINTNNSTPWVNFLSVLASKIGQSKANFDTGCFLLSNKASPRSDQIADLNRQQENEDMAICYPEPWEMAKIEGHSCLQQGSTK